jgi:hypothetical protein
MQANKQFQPSYVGLLPDSLSRFTGLWQKYSLLMPALCTLPGRTEDTPNQQAACSQFCLCRGQMKVVLQIDNGAVDDCDVESEEDPGDRGH